MFHKLCRARISIEYLHVIAFSFIYIYISFTLSIYVSEESINLLLIIIIISGCVYVSSWRTSYANIRLLGNEYISFTNYVSHIDLMTLTVDC